MDHDAAPQKAPAENLGPANPSNQREGRAVSGRLRGHQSRCRSALGQGGARIGGANLNNFSDLVRWKGNIQLIVSLEKDGLKN